MKYRITQKAKEVESNKNPVTVTVLEADSCFQSLNGDLVFSSTSQGHIGYFDRVISYELLEKDGLELIVDGDLDGPKAYYTRESELKMWTVFVRDRRPVGVMSKNVEGAIRAFKSFNPDSVVYKIEYLNGIKPV